MKISLKTLRRSQSGYVLTLVLCFLLAALIIFSYFMNWAVSSSRVSVDNNMFNISQAAADARVFSSGAAR